MIEAGQVARIAFGFLVVWGIVALAHGVALSTSGRGNPLPPEAESQHEDH